jgi:hypothetical protein
VVVVAALGVEQAMAAQVVVAVAVVFLENM